MTGIMCRETPNQVAFRNPRVQKQLVMLVRFDQAGNVASVQRTGQELNLARRLRSKRATPTLGRKQSFFEELFGRNRLGRFAAVLAEAAATTVRNSRPLPSNRPLS